MPLSKTRQTNQNLEDHDSSEDESFKAHIRGIEASHRSTRKQVDKLKVENKNLKLELSKTTSVQKGSKNEKVASTGQLRQFQNKVKELTEELELAQEESKRLRKRLKKLQIEHEVKAESRQLEETLDTGDNWQNKYNEMKKILRKFRELMEENVLEDKDGLDEPTCAICHDGMDITKSTGLPCEHIFHTECIRSWEKTDRICPICRKAFLTDDLRLVTYTAGSQWEALLTTAQSWALLDQDHIEDEPETSERPSTPSFIDDGIDDDFWENSKKSNGPPAEDEDGKPMENSNDIDETNDPSITTPSTPVSKRSKRERLDSLSASRSAKRRRIGRMVETDDE